MWGLEHLGYIVELQSFSGSIGVGKTTAPVAVVVACSVPERAALHYLKCV